MNFEERKMLKRILEVRDQAINTTIYIVDMNGHRNKICDSIGYGFPYPTQFTKPSQNPKTVVLSRAEPNGLFSPPTSEGTGSVVSIRSAGICRSLRRTLCDRQPVSAARKLARPHTCVMTERASHALGQPSTRARASSPGT